jgi:protein SCO1/2
MTRRVLLPVLLCLLVACGRHREPLSRYQKIQDFVLISQDGQEFQSAEKLKGNIWVASFIFTTCTGPCPRMSSKMRQLQSRIANRDDIKLVSFTVDPENDTPPVLARYAERFGARQGVWYFLTGPMETLHSLARESFLLSNVDGSLNHSTRFVLVDRDGTVRKYYHSDDPGLISAITEDIGELLAGSS